MGIHHCLSVVSEGSELSASGQEAGNGGRKAGGKHTLSIGLILSQLPITTKRPVRRLLNGLN